MGKATRWIYLYRSKGWRPRRWEDVPRQPKTKSRSYKANGPKWRWCNTFGLVVWLGFCCSIRLFRPQLNAPDEFEGDSNWVGKCTKSSFQQKKNHPIRSPYEKLVCVLSQVCLCSPNLNPERERLGLYLLLGQKWRERTFWTANKHLFLPYLHMWIVQMSHTPAIRQNTKVCEVFLLWIT